MKQLFHTSCKKGFSVSGNSGFQVRAASAGLPDGRVRALLPFVGYEIPLASIDRSQLPEIAPIRLAMFDTPNAGRIIVHGVYVGQDPTTGRDGNYFSHLLCDIPDSITAKDVMRMWGSAAWTTRDGDSIEKQLGELETLPKDGSLDEHNMREFLAEPKHQEMFGFLLNAWLSLPEGGRIFLAATSTDIAACLWGLTQCLPASLQSELTFSTYEKNPLTSFARVIGAWWGNAPAKDLPHACYTGKNLGFNSFSDRASSTLPKSFAYVDFLVASCASANIQAVDEFHASIKPELLGDIEHLDWLYRLLHQPNSVSADELRAATEVPVLRQCVVEHPRAVVELTRTAVSDARYAKGVFSSLVMEISADSHRSRQVRDVAIETVLSAAENGDRHTLDAFFDSFVPSLGKSLQGDVINGTWERLDRPSRLCDDSYEVLLPRALGWFADKREEEQIEQWLTVPVDQLPMVLSANIDQSFKVRACLTICGDREESVREIAGPIRAHPELVIPVMKEIVETPTLGESCAQTLFCSALNGSHSKPVGDQLLARGGQLPHEVFEFCLRQCLESGCFTARDVATSEWRSLPLSSERRLALCNSIASESKVVELVTDASLSAFLSEVTANRNAPPALRSKVESLQAIRRFLSTSQVGPPSFRDVADALTLPFSREDQQMLIDVVARRFSERLLASQDVAFAWESLEHFLIAIGEVAGYRSLYMLLLSQAADSPTFWKRPPLLHGFLACGFGVSTRARCVPWNGDLIQDAKEFASQLAKRGGRRTFWEVNRQTKSWRAHGGLQQFQQWRMIARQIEPISLWQRTSKAVAGVSGLVGRLIRRGDDDRPQPPPGSESSGSSERRRPEPKRHRRHDRRDSDDPNIVYIDGSGGKTWQDRVHLFLNVVLVMVFLGIVWLLFFGEFPVLRFLFRWLWSSIGDRAVIW